MVGCAGTQKRDGRKSSVRRRADFNQIYSACQFGRGGQLGLILRREHEHAEWQEGRFLEGSGRFISGHGRHRPESSPLDFTW